MPVNSIFRSGFRSSNAATWVKLYSTFEGSFGVETSNVEDALLNTFPVEDPFGQGRHREVTHRRELYGLRGSAYWGKSGEIEGHATIKTSNGHATLVI
ncbi:hypothetical protein BDR07DRAFT_1418550 [Suillus spraguei]|nr:hypothetical protein BDR07DRAFT_1418550 [Suillus spraguei]